MTLADRYPLLYAPARWEWGGLDVQFSTDLPPDELVTNIHVISFVGDRIVLCRDARGVWLIPGGTREARESIDACIIRELAEEAGAELQGPAHWIGAHHTTSDRPAPYLPWQPHPHKAWLWCTADVALTGPPTNPEGAEQILEVQAFPPPDALRLAATDGPHMPDLLSLAIELHNPH
ncbi:NUDIX domain-containing protein [Nocardia sp. 2]|uniref:NUDIX domain-containing protein n=1 Tax=Nocardia acididurans TaxID=2802282 RepID=A0ABS1LZK8_9NOCA|nr:NUDIX domain-containing protein [Nocardia acididurans]MBL1073691.1 NUDIX domain-containing protein [Nocardia acididurans]